MRCRGRPGPLSSLRAACLESPACRCRERSSNRLSQDEGIGSSTVESISLAPSWAATVRNVRGVSCMVPPRRETMSE